jgi:hypothetical protein
MENPKEEKLNISKVAVSNKEKSLTIVHDEMRNMPSGKILISAGKTWPGNQPVHPDLLDTLQQFIPHFLMKIGMPGYKVFTADYIKKKKAIGDSNLDGFVILSVTIGDKGLMNISGAIKADSGALAALNANNISLDPETNQFGKELNIIWENLCEHAHDYFIEGKFGVGAQSELDLNVAGIAAERPENQS